MLGWHVSVYRQVDGSSPATQTSPEGALIAAWYTGLGGTSWLDQLAANGHTLHFSEGGYPERYTAQATHILPHLRDRTLTDIERAAASACSADEWLVIEAWDQS